VEWDCSVIDRRNGSDLAALLQQICGARDNGTHPYTTSYLDCGGAGGATNFYSGLPSCNLDARAAYGHTP
jgi:hypothetical protein